MAMTDNKLEPVPQALETRAEVVKLHSGNVTVRRGESDRLEAGKGDSFAMSTGKSSLQVGGSLIEQAGSRTISANRIRSTINGRLSMTTHGDVTILGGAMAETHTAGGIMTVAGMSDNLVGGGGVRVTAPVDAWLAHIVGMEEKIATAMADGALAEIAAVQFEREYGPSVWAIGSALWTGTTCTTQATGFVALCKVTTHIRNLVAGAGGGGEAPPPPSPPPAALVAGAAVGAAAVGGIAGAGAGTGGMIRLIGAIPAVGRAGEDAANAPFDFTRFGRGFKTADIPLQAPPPATLIAASKGRLGASAVNLGWPELAQMLVRMEDLAALEDLANTDQVRWAKLQEMRDLARAFGRMDPDDFAKFHELYQARNTSGLPFNPPLAMQIIEELTSARHADDFDAEDLRHIQSIVDGPSNTLEELRPRLQSITAEQLESLRQFKAPEGWSFDDAWQAFKDRWRKTRSGSWYERIAMQESFDELELITESFRVFIPEDLWPSAGVGGLTDVGEWRKALVQVLENTADPDARMVIQHVLDAFDGTAYRVFQEAHQAADARMLGPLPPLPPSVDAAALEATLNAGMQQAQARFLELSELGTPQTMTAEQLAEYHRVQALTEMYHAALTQVRQGLDPSEYLRQEIAQVEDLALRNKLSWATQVEDFRAAFDTVMGQLRQHGVTGLPVPSATPAGVVADGSSVRHVNAAEGVGSWSDTVTAIARRASMGAYDSADVLDVVDLGAADSVRFAGDSATATLTPAQRAEDFAGLTDASGPYSVISDVDADDARHAPTDVAGDNVRVADGQYSVIDDPEFGRGGYSDPDAPPTAPPPPPPNKVPTVNARPRLSPDNYSTIEDMITASDDPYTTVEDVVSGRAYDSAADNYTAPAATVGVNASGDAVAVQRVPDPPAAQLSGEQQRLLQFYEPAPAPGYDFEFVTYRKKIKGETAPPPGVRWITPNFDRSGKPYMKPDGVYGDIEFRTIGLVEQRINYRDPMSNKAILAADPGRATKVGKGRIHDGAPDVVRLTTKQADAWENGKPVFELDETGQFRLDRFQMTLEIVDATTMQKLDPQDFIVRSYAGGENTADVLKKLSDSLTDDAATGQRYREMMQSRYDAYTDWHRQATKNATKGSSNIDTRPPMPTPELMGGFAPTHPGEWVRLDPADEFLSYLQWQGPMKANGKFY